MPSTTRSLAWFFPLVLAACAAEPTPAPAPVASAAEPLYGPITFEGCTATEAQQLQQAIDWLRGRASTTAWCLAEALPTDHLWASAETIGALASTRLGLTLKCVDDDCGTNPLVAACASPIAAGDPERVLVVRRFLAKTPFVEAVGSSLAHELMHNHGFQHPNGYQVNSVPDLIEECVLYDHPLTVHHEHLSDRAPIAHVGGAGGTEQDALCGPQQIATGIFGATGGALTRFGLRCQSPLLGQLSGDVRVGGGAVPGGSTPFEDVCPTGQTLIGLWGWAGDMVTLVQPVCETLAKVRSDEGRVFGDYIGPEHGTRSGEFFFRYCPSRQVVTGARLAQGSQVNRVALVCDDVRSLRVPATRDAGSSGGNGGAPFSRACEGNGVMTGLFGRHNGDSVLQTLGAECSPMTGEFPDYGARTRYFVDPAGPALTDNGDAGWRKTCADSQVMVGMRLVSSAVNGHGPYVRNATPLCARFDSWRDGTGVPAAVGDSAILTALGTVTDVTCNAREVVVGFTGREGSLIDRVAVTCAEPEAGGKIMTVASAGAAPIGRQSFARCPLGEPMTGIALGFDAQLTAASGRCGRVYGTAVHGRLGYAMPTFGKADAALAERACAAGEVVVGFAGDLSGSQIRRFAPICQPLTEVRKRTTLLRVERAGVGAAATGTTPFQTTCYAGFMVQGITADDTGSGIDSVQPWCGNADLLIGDTVSFQMRGADDFFRVQISDDQLTQVKVYLEGPVGSNVDLLARRGLPPSDAAYDARSSSPGASEVVSLGFPRADYYWIRVHPVSGSGRYTLRIAREVILLPL